MPRKRLPKSIADATGASLKNPARYRRPVAGRLRGDDLGPAPKHLSPNEATIWAAFRAEMPWLRESDRVITEIATKLRTRLEYDGELGVKGINLLRLCLASMGGTPVDRSKIHTLGDGEEDPAQEFLN